LTTVKPLTYNVLTLKAYKYKLNPSDYIEQKLDGVLNGCRELYNAGLQERRDAYKLSKVSINYLTQQNQLPAIRKDRPDISNIYSQVLQDVLRRLDKAFDAFFLRIKKGQTPGYPRFKGKQRYNSFTYPQSGFRLEGNKLHLSKIGKIKLHLSRPVEGKIKTCQIKGEADGWYVIFTVEENQSRFFAKTGKTTGVDVGIENFAALGNGEMIDNPKFFRKAERRLKISQRSLSRKKLRSKNRRKAADKVARQHLNVKRQRRDFHHKESLKLVKGYDQLTFEDLNIAGMLKNHHLAKSIADAGWNTFMQITEAKAVSAGRKFVKVQAAFSSQDCSECNNRVKKSLSEREHRCIACGLVMHRDTNSANILDQRGRAFPRVDGRRLPEEARTYSV
jgi:putative transposase